MTTQRWLTVLRQRWWLVLAGVAVGLLSGAAYLIPQVPTYTATSRVFISTQLASSVADLAQGASFSQEAVASYAEVATSPIVLDPVIGRLGLDVSPSSLASRISASGDASTSILAVSVVDTSATRAARIANAIDEELSRVVDVLAPKTSGGGAVVKVTTITPASDPPAPDHPLVLATLLLAAIGGLCIGLAATVVLAIVDRRVRSVAELSAVSGLPVLGSIEFDPEVLLNPVAGLQSDRARSPRLEAYNELRTNLEFMNADSPVRSVLISSATAGEGKTVTAVNLARSIAASGRSVVLVDGDLRRPAVATYLGLAGDVGLTDVLVGHADLVGALQSWRDGTFMVLPAGEHAPNPSELLGSGAMDRLLVQLLELHDYVVIDAPPVLPVTDAAVLSTKVDGILMVCAVGATRSDYAISSMTKLTQVGGRVLGFVASMVRSKAPAYSYYAGAESR